MEDKCTSILRKLTNKKYILFTDSGNRAIFLSLKLMKNLNKTNIITQDQGGWITYPQYIKRLKLNQIILKTDNGIINPEQLKNYKNNVILINSLTGYFAEQPIKEIQNICIKNNILLINDASGSIGTDNAKTGGIILGSFGRDKPVNLCYGGFIATNNEKYHEYLKENFNKELREDFTKTLYKELKKLNKRLAFFWEINNKIKTDLEKHEIIHKNKKGINVIIKYSTKKEKKIIEDYCKKNNYEYTECPRYIRVTQNAISIEVKRLSF